MKTLPIVSILVTVYNRESYLADCLDSILASSYGGFEVIVVDDASSDGSVAIGESYAARDPRIRFYSNPVNLGDYGNRNRAASLASGTYLKYLDADDALYPHALRIGLGKFSISCSVASRKLRTNTITYHNFHSKSAF